MSHLTVLAADTSEGVATLRTIFGKASQVIAATCMDEAVRQFGRGFDVIVCGVHFDESRMFDLLRVAKADARMRDVPFVCYRDLDTDLGAAVIEGLTIACKALGESEFLDVYTLKRRRGVERADEELRWVVEALSSHATMAALQRAPRLYRYVKVESVHGIRS